jgi:hypothetical protein
VHANELLVQNYFLTFDICPNGINLLPKVILLARAMLFLAGLFFEEVHQPTACAQFFEVRSPEVLFRVARLIDQSGLRQWAPPTANNSIGGRSRFLDCLLG